MNTRKTAIGLLVGMLLTLTPVCMDSVQAWEDREHYFQSDSYRDSQRREEDHTDRLNRETRQRDEDSRREQSRDYEDRRRSDELRSYSRTDRDGYQQTCQSTRLSTVCQ